MNTLRKSQTLIAVVFTAIGLTLGVVSMVQMRSDTSASEYPRCTSGPTGAPGSNGTNGSPGSSGAPGSNGTNGTNGSPGASGAPGSNGTNGTNGSPGPSGAPGTNGSNGTNGVDGAAGTCDPAIFGALTTDLIPSLDNTFVLGTPTKRWKSLQLGPGTLFLEDVITGFQAGLTVSGGTLLIDGADSLRIGNIRLTSTGIESLNSHADITIGNSGDSGYLSTARGIKFPDGSVQNSAIAIGNTGPAGPTGPAGADGTLAGDYGSFLDDTIQANKVGANEAIPVLFNTIDSASGVSRNADKQSQITFKREGVYDIQFSAQFDKLDSGTDDVDVWLSINGRAVPYSNTRITMTGNNVKNVAAWNFFVTVRAEDYVEIMWSSADRDMRIYSEGPTSNPDRPGIPSVIATVNQVH